MKWNGERGGTFSPYDENRYSILEAVINDALENIDEGDVVSQYLVLSDIYRAEGLCGLEIIALSNALDITETNESIGNPGMIHLDARALREKLIEALDRVGYQGLLIQQSETAIKTAQLSTPQDVRDLAGLLARHAGFLEQAKPEAMVEENDTISLLRAMSAAVLG